MKSRKIIKLLGLILILLVINACATNKHISLQPDAIPNITSTDVCIAVSQQEIYGDINKSNMSAAMGGGLIAALVDVAVDNSRSKKAENEVQAIRDELVDYDFNGILKDKIQTELNSVDWMKVQKIDIEGVVTSENFDNYLSASDSSSVLFITTKYFFSPDFKTLEITSDTKLFPNNEELKTFAKSYNGESNPTDDVNCMYKNSFIFRDQLDENIESKEEAVKLWGGNNASITREALEKGAYETAKMITLDLIGNISGNEDKITIGNISGDVIVNDGKRSIIRSKNGTMYSLRNPESNDISKKH